MPVPLVPPRPAATATASSPCCQLQNLAVTVSLSGPKRVPEKVIPIDVDSAPESADGEIL